MFVSSWVAVQLAASQEGLRFTDLVSETNIPNFWAYASRQRLEKELKRNVSALEGAPEPHLDRLGFITAPSYDITALYRHLN
jgi:hypothetical protein